MRVAKVKVAELVNDPANVRKHSEKNLEAIKGSLARFGQQKPIVVGSDGVVVAGNGTLEAARQLGWQDVAIVKTKLTGSDRTAYAIADNRTGELAEWDDAALAEQLSALAIDDDGLLAAAGFDEAELEKLVNETTGMEDIVEDEAPEPPADPVTKPGDLWQLGEHRVLCGDSTKAEDVARLMGGEKADMVHTDPPYGVDYHGPYGTMYYGGKAGKPREKLASDYSEPEAMRLLACAMPFMDASIVMIWHAVQLTGEIGLALAENRMKPFAYICWNKNHANFGAMGACYKPKFEMATISKLKSGTIPWYGPNNEVTVWDINRESRNKFHPTQKPVELAARAIANHTVSGQLVIDLFLGSGTTLIAAEQLGRKCYGIEISPAYCDVIVERWENLTGKKAKRVTDGKAA